MVVVKILIVAPKSTREFEKVCPLICDVTIGFLGSSYLTVFHFLIIGWIRCQLLGLLGYLLFSSLVFSYIALSWSLHILGYLG